MTINMSQLVEGVWPKVPEEVYHADPCIAPSLSSSIAKTLLSRSPRHAWYEHPRLNPAREPEEKEEFNLGKAAHAMILGEPQNFAVIDPNDYPAKTTGAAPKGWTNAAIKAARDEAYAAGKIPLLKDQHETIERMVIAGREQLRYHECSDAFIGGQSELTLVWKEGDVWCRCRIDHSPGANVFYDYKTTQASANPDSCSNYFSGMGYDITSAFYRRGIRKVLGIENPVYNFVVQEIKEPHCLSVVGYGPDVDFLADRKVEEAIRIWGHCLRENRWPGYSSRKVYIGIPTYSEKAWLERESREQMQEEEGRDYLKELLDWNA